MGKTLKENLDYLISLHKKDYSHCCGEGGEFESFVVDCPLYKKKIHVVEQELVVEDDRPLSYVAWINFKKLELINK